MHEVKEKILKVLNAIPNGVLYSTTDWHRLLGEDRREIRHALEDLETEGKIETQKSGRSDKPFYKLKEEVKKERACSGGRERQARRRPSRHKGV